MRPRREVGSKCCSLMYPVGMPTAKKPVRKSVSVPPAVAKRVQSLAKARRTSENRVLVELIETGLEAKEQEKRRYLDLLEQLRSSNDESEQERLMEELAQLTFGD